MPNPKVSTVLLVILMSIAVVSCTRKIEERNTVERDGLLYELGAEHPFSGTVIGRGREGYRREACDYKKEYTNGLLDGEAVYLYPNGKLESKVPYKKGVINGFVVRYWPNGRPKARIHFVGGMRGGAKGEMFWDKDGHQVRR